MSLLRSYINNILSEDALPGMQWVDFDLSSLDPVVLNRIWTMYTNTYLSMGMDLSAASASGLLKYKGVFLIDVDNPPDGVPDAFIIYKPTPFGNKMALLGTCQEELCLGKRAAKKAVVKKMFDLLKGGGFFIEAGEKIEIILRNSDVPPVCDQEMIKSFLGRKFVRFLDDCYYQRKLAMATAIVTKRLYGSFGTLHEDTHTFHGYEFGPDKVGLPGPEFDDADRVTDADVDDAIKWLDQHDPTELVAFSRGSAVLHQMMNQKPEKWNSKEVPKVTYVSPAALRKWTGAPVPNNVPGGSKVVHSMGDNIVPLKQACQVAAQTGADMYIVPGKADGKDHVRALRYRGKGGKMVDPATCVLDDDLPDWGQQRYATPKELEKQMHRGKELTGDRKLRQFIREVLSMVDGDPRDTPLEKEFVDGPDVLAGYIVVRDGHDHNMIAHAPITRTDGPDRPYLVRTTDTHWEIPFGIVRVLYPQVEDVFNQVDSKEDWNNLGPGDRGEVGGFEWEWVDVKPTP